MTEVPPGFPKVKGSERPWACKYENENCTRTKPCNRCRGARNRRSGMRKQREARKALERVTGAQAARFMGQLGNEEAWTGLPVIAEVKSGQVAQPVWTKFAAAEAQALANKAVGDIRPVVAIFMGTRTSDGLLVCRLSQLDRVVEALVNELNA